MCMVAFLLTAGGCFHTVKPRVDVDASFAPGAFPHEILDGVLGKYVKDGQVDYKSIQGDRGELDRYLAFVGEVSPLSDPSRFPTKDDELAYWINAYNAVAITAVIDRPGLVSVVDNKVDFFYATKYVMGGDKIDLYKLENGIVRPTYADPRVHFALNCQSGGCPVLPSDAFPAAGLDAYLDEQARLFVNNPGKVQIEGTTVRVSQIFEWYKEDFEPAGGALKFVSKYRSDVPEGATLEYIPYDWTLIAVSGRGP
jgi:hypothetical protein